MGQALSFIPTHKKIEMRSTRSRGQSQNKNNEENINTTKKTQKRKTIKQKDDNSIAANKNLGKYLIIY